MARHGSLPAGNGHCRREAVERVGQQRIIAAYEAPLVFANVVHFAAHVVVPADHVDLVLEKEALMGHAQLIHRVQRLPSLCIHIK